MPRPGFVLDVERSTPPVLFWRGEQFATEKLPAGSRVVYAPEPVAALKDPAAAVREALENPVAGEPLSALLFSDMKLTIAFDDVSLPLPPMQSPDNRQVVIEAVLDLAAQAGVDDIELVAALALHRRMHDYELRHALGDRVYNAFAPKGLLKQHDAEDHDNLIELGTTDKGEIVEINKRAATSDLLVYVNINLVSMDGGWKSTATGLSSYRSIRHHHNPETMERSTSFMDNKNSQLHDKNWRMGQLLNQHVKVFQIETTMNTDTFPKPFSFLEKREWEWSAFDRATYLATKKATDLAPARVNRQMFHNIKSPHAMTDVFAGTEVEVVHERTTAKVYEQHLVPVEGQTDVLTMGVPYICPYNVNSIMNPILVAVQSLGYFFNLYKGKPLVREGGALIVHHPTPWEFNTVHHPSYIDFFDEVLADTTDPHKISHKYEERFATDPWYIHLYRTGNAYHGVHPFYMWYWCAHALKHLGGVIVVGGNTAAVRRLGFKPASTFQDALEMARDITGNREPSITHFHAPPIMMADVR